MAVERTLSIIKPDATARNLTGRINTQFEDAGLRIIAQKRLQLTREQAEAFLDLALKEALEVTPHEEPA